MVLACRCVVVVVVVLVVVGVACIDLLILFLGVVIDALDTVLRLLECCTSNVVGVVVVDVGVFLDCGGFSLLCIGLFCFVDCCFFVAVLVVVVCLVLVLGFDVVVV